MIYRQASALCPVCGVTHAACGQSAEVVPVDIPTTEVPPVNRALKRYAVTVNGYRTHMHLNEVDAERLGGELDERDTATAVDEPARKADAEPPNKARTPRNK